MRKKSKMGLHLVTDKTTKKRFDTFTIYGCDGTCYEYKLNEWNVFKDPEWIEVTKVDDTVMECFNIQNVLVVRFRSSKAEDSKPPLQPVA
jgi:hypothetical protein